ncbi:hypothetical protein DUNSADRAFT_9226 [Dunaliella salina]|uniref:Uncharacterized protein n=1 Tax=Dunaliella salina TaxID=3046 RepID=A0ABQ7GHV8_DUNSA|nr:hypothetical protein DUNSADRAFT_9226 [Dunaliella salina]|eukprot:KAF5834196.1 hypothetical protein DUNSADRAFT_9226 [Dunaliella salina]
MSTGVPMIGPDGVERLVAPVVLNFIGDNLELSSVAGTFCSHNCNCKCQRCYRQTNDMGSLTDLEPTRYYDLELPLSLKKGYFFEACHVQGHEHANVSKILPHLLVGLTSVARGVDLPMDLAIAWRLHQMTSTGEKRPSDYVGSQQQASDLRASSAHLLQCFLAFEDDLFSHTDDEEEAITNQSSARPWSTVKLHHVLVHAPHILGHGHEKHYSAQHFEKKHKIPKGDYKRTNGQTGKAIEQMVQINSCQLGTAHLAAHGCQPDPSEGIATRNTAFMAANATGENQLQAKGTNLSLQMLTGIIRSTRIENSWE